MTSATETGRVLVLTVGTGNTEDLERTLIRPMLKSIEDGDWTRVVLLASRVSDQWAQELRERVQNTDIEICTLPEAGQENHADACFGHFDEVLGGLVGQGFAPASIVADFTRGTKAMSAALVLAAVRRDIPRLRYVHSEERDERGMVVPGTEKVGEIGTSLVTFRKRLDLAADLMRHGDFGAVEALLPDPKSPMALALRPDNLHSEAEGLRSLCEAYAAWDRLDHPGAKEALGRYPELLAEVPKEFRLDEKCIAWLDELASEPERCDTAGYARWLRALACDLLANAERRLRDRQFEDTLIRAYRILELVGQCRLFDKGYDSACIPDSDSKVEEFRKRLRRKGSQDFGVGQKPGFLSAPRLIAARFLKHLGDPLGRELAGFDDANPQLGTASRNHSLLIHGFSAAAPSGDELRELLGRLKDLLVEDDGGASGRLAIARQLDFGSRS